jgi:uncharacterized coiled-coil protein SlyX
MLDSQKRVTEQLAGQNVLLEAKIRTLESRLAQVTRERDSFATEVVEGKLNSEKLAEDAVTMFVTQTFSSYPSDSICLLTLLILFRRAQVERLELAGAHHDQVVEELRRQLAAEKERFEVQQQLSQKQTSLLENLMEENAKVCGMLPCA